MGGIILWLFAAIVMLHIVGTLMPTYDTWGFHTWSLLPELAAWSILAAALLFVVPVAGFPLATLVARPFSLLAGRIPKVRRSVMGAVVSLLAFALLYALRSRAHVYGDGFFILGAIDDPAGLVIHGQSYLQVLSMLLDHFSVGVIENALRLSTEDAFAIVNCIGGVVGLWALYRISGLLAVDSAAHRFIFLGSLTSGSVILFFGYVEHYTWPTSLALWALYYTIRHVRGRKSGGKALLLALLATGFHLIALPYLVLAIASITSRQSLLSETSYGKAPMMLAATVVLGSAALAALLQFTDLPDVFVPLWPVADNSYWFLSLAHLKDVINEAILVAPLGSAFLVLNVFASKRRGGGRAGVGRILAGLSLLTFLASFWIDPELGAARDWDLLSFFGFPLSLWGAYRLSQIVPRRLPLQRLIIPVGVTMLLHVTPGLIEKTDLKTATRHLDRMLWSSPQYQVDYQKAERAMVWGTILRDSADEPELALKYFRRRLKADSTSITSWFCLGDWFAERQQYDSAAFYLRRMALLNPTNAGYLLKLAIAEAEAQNYDTARAIMRHCTSLAPQDYRLQLAAGLIAFAAGNDEEALVYYRTTQRLAPETEGLALNMGLLFSRRRQYDSVYAYMTVAQQKSPRDESIYRYLLAAQVALGKIDEARRTFELYRQMFPGTPGLEALLPEVKRP